MKKPAERRFQDLSPAEVLALAIAIERANARRFRSFALSFRGYDEEVARRFEEMALEEEEHERMLAQAGRGRFPEAPPGIDEDSVAERIETVDLDDAEHQIFDSLRPQKVYELSLAAEEEARSFYVEAAAVCADPVLAALYRELGGMEDEHVAWCRSRLEEARRAGHERD